VYAYIFMTLLLIQPAKRALCYIIC